MSYRIKKVSHRWKGNDAHSQTTEAVNPRIYGGNSEEESIMSTVKSMNHRKGIRKTQGHESLSIFKITTYLPILFA